MTSSVGLIDADQMKDLRYGELDEFRCFEDSEEQVEQIGKDQNLSSNFKNFLRTKRAV
jgi:hypothetical protein